MTVSPPLTIVTYNVHGCVGMDRRHDVGRVAHVLGALDADIIGLQEVLGADAALDVMTVLPVASGGDALGTDQLAVFAHALGYEARAGANLMRAGRRYGNALLSRHPIRAARRLNLSDGVHEPRGAIDALIATPGGTVRVAITHFGLNGPERAWQAARLARFLEVSHPDQACDSAPRSTIVLGDFNDMWPPSHTYRPIVQLMEHRPPWRRTWPAPAPILPLDKVWPGPGATLDEVYAWRGPLARMASDHLPLVARVSLDASASNFHSYEPRTALRGPD
ncbi:hypothetical protein F1188_00775 [Roseospira marina]|uniref:Endonuclease/exonuclease/phosphatase domain-containing protein n=1 Tax=Roseospira marina TaxID=140057 RepID=A0A5M6II47_9PROT|nr:endonuclease/exonuclease/phosphatase family protein [Roseospira marina]KAA5607335.1 hypothetical protein F1188_00775 [Roseospira marina]MBB4312502.1 endonuclease/exonuclease/phosphatase family metal-dependent hydrolase [Roseospira marina]MBB5085482.1 endonuclease/exonuclease/phosphatase family metal-dependent hydrolase [Roseospira marina]